jgi:hypothetical protein
MLRHDLPRDEPAPEALEPDERLVAGPWRVIVWGSGRSLAGGPLSLSDRYLRFSPAWAGLDAVLHAGTNPSSPPPLLRVPRDQIVRVSWEHALQFLKNLRMELPENRTLHLLGGKDTLQQLAAALEVTG